MSQVPNKSLQKMCKSPKSSSFQVKQEKIDYENMSTNCTVVGSNNLNLVKKPQLVTNMSPAYSNPSPGYPQSPYSSPASLKSPSPSLKPPTPQPNFPVMQIFHNNLITRPIQTSQSQNIIKLKPPLNILPKPSASPQPSPKPSVSPQIVIPAPSQQATAATATLMPTAQPLLLNQMPMLAAPGVQFILRPQTATTMAHAGPKLQATAQGHQGLILQPANATQQLLQLGGPARSQPMVRVLANGVQYAPSTTTYVTTQMANQPINATHIQQTIVNNSQQQQQQHVQVQHVSFKKKPKIKVKKKLDLANIMKLSGIGDEDDIQFESDTSLSESERTTPQPQHHQHQQVQTSHVQAQTSYVHTDATKKNIQNIQISAMPQQISAGTPVVQVLNQNFQSGMISNSTSQAAAAQASIPFNSFITPNFTINNGLMYQRSGAFKLTVGEDGRLVLQHDPTLNQDLQSQLILQSLLGLNGGLVLQPSMDQQTVQQTVQTIQQQSVQTIQQQTVQSQTIQTVQQQTVQPQVQHTIQSLQPQIQQQTVQQTIQHQTVNALQQPMQIVQPQPIHSIHSQVQPIHSISQSQVHNLQSQIQSLLQQQNVAVQAQAVHQNVPQNVHSQIQSVQNLTQNVQNVQNLAQSSVQNVVAQNVQNVQNLSQSSVQNVNVQNLAQTSMQNVVAQNVQNMAQTAVQNMTQNTVQNVVAQNLAAAAAAQNSVQNVVAQNMSQQGGQVQNLVAQNMSQNATVQNVVAQNMSQGVQSVQNVQSVQSQPLQSPVHTVQGFQQAHTQTTQPILKVQPFQKSQPPVQTVQPIQHQSHQHHNMQESQQNQQHNNPPPTSYVVNLTPDQLEQLKRNGQLTVNGQTIFMQRPNKDHGEKKLSPKAKPMKKVHKIQGIKSSIHDHHQNDATSERKPPPPPHNVIEQIKSPPPPRNIKPLAASPVVGGVGNAQPPAKQALPQSHVQPIQSKPQQPQAMVQPSVQHQVKMERQKSSVVAPKQQKVSPTVHLMQQDSNGANTSHDVDKLLGQILEESNGQQTGLANNNINHGIERQPQQRITTIQLTPQKQQHLKSIQMQIQTLSARLQPGDTDVHNTLKVLFAEQQKILASGKLLPPDKVYYHNNQLTIVNPSSLNLPSPSSIKNEPSSPVLSNNNAGAPRSTSVETVSTSNQPITTQTHSSPRVSVSVSTSTGDLPTHSTIHHHPVHHQVQQQQQQHGAGNHHHQGTQSGNLQQNNHQVAAAPSQHATVGVGHANHVIGQRLSAIGQISQLPPLYPKQPALHSPQLHSPQLHSPQLHSPQLHSPKLQHSPKLHSPQINSPQMPSPQPPPHHIALPTQSAQQNQQHAVVGGIQHHLHHGPQNQQCQTVSPQVVKKRQQSPIPQLIKTQQHQQQHALNQQQAPIQIYQQQQQQQHQQQQHFHPQQQQSMQQQLHQQQHGVAGQQHGFVQQQLSHPIQQKQQQQQQVAQVSHQHQQQLSLAKKAHLIETQLNLDQNGATKPDVHTPFRDHKDACIRLVRYHCMDQPVLSEKDLSKADEIFELTARHFIGKFGKMVDKYKYLLMKESMRQVQTSELMMLDRMFLADEQQSLIRLRQDYETELLNLTAEPSTASNASAQQGGHDRTQQQNAQDHDSISEEYDEWACIQRELGCLPQGLADPRDLQNHPQPSPQSSSYHHHHHLHPATQAALNAANQHQQQLNLKRTSSSDSRLETLKRFRHHNHHKNNTLNSSGGGAGQSSNNNSGVSPGGSSSKCGYESNTSQANSSYGSTTSSKGGGVNNGGEESENNSIDEQVQSAINSILNLQQSTAQMQQSNALDLDSILS